MIRENAEKFRNFCKNYGGDRYGGGIKFDWEGVEGDIPTTRISCEFEKKVPISAELLPLKGKTIKKITILGAPPDPWTSKESVLLDIEDNDMIVANIKGEKGITESNIQRLMAHFPSPASEIHSFKGDFDYIELVITKHPNGNGYGMDFKEKYPY